MEIYREINEFTLKTIAQWNTISYKLQIIVYILETLSLPARINVQKYKTTFGGATGEKREHAKNIICD